MLSVVALNSLGSDLCAECWNSIISRADKWAVSATLPEKRLKRCAQNHTSKQRHLSFIMLSLHWRTGISAEGVIAHKNNQWSLSFFPFFFWMSEGKGGEVTAELIIRGRTRDGEEQCVPQPVALSLALPWSNVSFSSSGFEKQTLNVFCKAPLIGPQIVF